MPKEQEIQHNATRKKAMLLALEDSYGIVSPAAKVVGIDRTTHYRWYNEDPEYKAAVDDLENLSLDHTESKLKELINGVTVEGGIDLETGETKVYRKEPNPTAVIFHLKTKGKKRGYVERVENITETHNNTGKVFTTVDFSKLNEEELNEYIEHQKRMDELESKIGTQDE